MGLINKTVQLKWSPNIKKYYESIGYSFTKMGDTFEVNIEDLTKGSSVTVYVKCDGINCKNSCAKEIKWQNFIKQVKDDGKYYCKKCIKVFTKYKMIETRIKNGKSFEQWCIENNRQDILERWDYDLNDCIPSEVTYKSKKKFWFKCPLQIHKSEMKGIQDFTSGNIKSIDCKACNSFAQWGIDNFGEDFLSKYWDYEKNINVNPWNILKCSHTNVLIRCQEKIYHGSYEITCNAFVNGVRCSFCGNFKVHFLDSLGTLYPEVLEVWSTKNKKTPYEYSPFSMELVYWKCPNNKHEDYKREIATSNQCEFRCPECVRERDESFLQEKVRLYLNTLNYTILHEDQCSIFVQNPKIKNKWGKMLFDNEIKELKLIIEVHGIQHYKISVFHYLQAKHNNTIPEYELHYQKLKDRYKRIYAKSKGYEYLEIPYWADDKKETWKDLIINKIISITNL